MAALPRGQAVEIEMIVEVRPDSFGKSASGDSPLELIYFGTAGWRISDGKVGLLVDPYLSRR